MAKRFLFVCGGLLLLTLTWNVWASTVAAQSTCILYAGASASATAVLCGRTVASMSRDGGPVTLYPMVPGESSIVAAESNETSAFVVLANGDVMRAFVGGPWHVTGNLLSGGPVPAERASLGQLKWRFHNGGGQ